MHNSTKVSIFIIIRHIII